MNNVIENPRYQDELDRLRSALAEHLAMTDDPFRYLRNDLPMPVDGYADQRRG